MPDRTQDLKNHRQVAVACKNYTDTEIKKSEERILSIVARNNVNYIDHIDEASYKITAPANAKLLMLQSIGGNTVKLSPSVASDSTKALIKTMPSTVYTFDGSKFYGDSEVSENLLILQDKAETTISGVTYKIEKGIIYFNGTATNDIIFTLNSFNFNVGNYVAIDLGNFYQVDVSYVYINNLWQNFIATGKQINITTAQTQYIQLYIKNGTTLTNVISKPMLVKGSTTPTDFKVGYTGIHNIELTGIRSEGINVFGSNDVATGTNVGVTSKVENNLFYLDGTTNAYGAFFAKTNLLTPIKAGTYSVRYFVKSGTGTNIWITLFDTDGNIVEQQSMTTTAKTLTFSKDIVAYRLFNWSGATYTNLYFYFSFSRSAVNTYSDYVAPTIKTIDLSTILYNGNPLFEGNSLKAVNDVKDILTPYKATKKLGYVALDGLTWEYNSNGVYISTTRISSKVNLQNAICSAYEYNGNANSGSASTMASNLSDKQMCSYSNADNAGKLVVKDSSLGTTGTPSGYLVYELATPIEVSIDWSATLRNIQGYPNGSIIAENTHNMDVESVITYNSIIQETLCPSVTVDGANRFDNANTTLVNSTFNASNQTLFSYGGFALKVFNLTIGQTYTITSTKTMLLGETNDLTNSGTVSNGTSYTFTATTNYLLITNYLPNEYEEIFENLMINYGSTALSYRPYKPSITRNLPTQASDGWSAGTQRNYRVFCDDEGNAVSKRETNVSKESNLRTLDWNKGAVGNNWVFYSNNLNSLIKAVASSNVPNLLTTNYKTTNYKMWSDFEDKTVSENPNNNALNIIDLSYNDTTTFKMAMANEPLYYELADASKTETDLDDFDYFFDVEEGDVITFNNPYAQQVYATYSFLIKEAKSNE